MDASKTEEKAWALAEARLPEDVSGWRVLAVAPGDDERQDCMRLGAAEVVECEQPAATGEHAQRPFELIRYSRATPTTVHPLTAFTTLWHVAAPEGVLVVDSPILEQAAVSQYARFAPSPDDTAGPQWVPGRLALRWMIEVSGFDLVHWLGERPRRRGDSAPEASALLQAVRSERLPALDLTEQLVAG